MTKIGLLHTGIKDSFTRQVAALKSGLGAMGYWAQQEALPAGYTPIGIEERWANDNPKVLEDYAEELAEQGEVSVIVAAGGPQAAVAAMAKTLLNRKHVVFTTVADPREIGLVDSNDKPGRNLTGMAGKTSELDADRLDRLRQVLLANSADTRKKVTVLKKTNRPKGQEQYDRLAQHAAGHPDLELDPEDVGTLAELTALDARAGAIHGRLVTADSWFNNNRKIVVQASRNKPVIYQWREFAEIGGLMSYGPDIQEAYFTAGVYVGRILSGHSVPATMAVSVPTRYELVINVKTARDAGISIPQSLLDAADVIIDGTVEVRR